MQSSIWHVSVQLYGHQVIVALSLDAPTPIKTRLEREDLSMNKTLQV
jgi:hypothetical protein